MGIFKKQLGSSALGFTSGSLAGGLSTELRSLAATGKPATKEDLVTSAVTTGLMGATLGLLTKPSLDAAAYKGRRTGALPAVRQEQLSPKPLSTEQSIPKFNLLQRPSQTTDSANSTAPKPPNTNEVQ